MSYQLKMADSKTCPVCMDTYTKDIRLRVQCPYCPAGACKGCVSRYLLTTYDDPHCMECKRGWSREFLDTHLTKTFRTGNLKKHRAKILMEREKAFLPAHQVFVEGLKEVRRLEPIIAEANLKHEDIVRNRRKILVEREKLGRTFRTEQDIPKRNEIREKIRENAVEYGKNESVALMGTFERTDLDRQYLVAQNQWNGTVGQTPVVAEAREFIQRCPAEACRGYLSTGYKCGVCSKFTCAECLAIKGDSRDVEHTCNEEAKASAALIKRETKPCPKCGVRIYKIDGCFAKDTPILCWNGQYKMSQDIRVGDILVGDDGKSRAVEELCSGGDEMFEVSQRKGISYTVNSKHKLALKFSGEKSIHWSESENAWKVRWFDRDEHVMKTKKSRVTPLFNKEEAYHMLKAFCDALYLSDVIEITVEDYMKLTDSTKKHLMGFKSTGNHYRVNISGEHLSEIPTRVARKKCVDSNSTKDELRTGILVKPQGKGTYYGWSVSGNKRFLLADFTVVRNCDQMWCTQEGCHTAFSWRTGHMVTGVVHNPHYYEFLRSQNGGQVPREAGDVPCGGLPQVWTLSRRVQGIMGLHQAEKTKIYNVHRSVSDILYERLPQYPARRPAGLNRDINIRYLMNEMSDDEWKKMLEQRESKCEKKREIGQVLSMFTQVASESFQALERERVDAKFMALWRDVVSKQLEDLRIYTNKCLGDLGKRMICAIPQIDKDWVYIPPRKDPLNEIVAVAPAVATQEARPGFPTTPALVEQQQQQNTIITEDDYVDDAAVVVE